MLRKETLRARFRWLDPAFLHVFPQFSFSLFHLSFLLFILLLTSRSWENSLSERMPRHVFVVRTWVKKFPLYSDHVERDRESEDEERARRCVTGKCHATVIYLWTPKGWWMRRCADGAGRQVESIDAAGRLGDDTAAILFGYPREITRDRTAANTRYIGVSRIGKKIEMCMHDKWKTR